MIAEDSPSAPACGSSRGKQFQSLQKKYLRLSWRDYLILERWLRNIGINGSIGAGKSVVLDNLMLASFEAGDGALILCPNQDTEIRVSELAWQAGRGHDLIVVRPDGKRRCNVIEYALNSVGGRGSIEEAFDDLWCGVELVNRGTVSKQGDAFFDTGGKMLLKYGMVVLYGAYQKVNLGKLLEIIQTLPPSIPAMEEHEERYAILRHLEVARQFFKRGENHQLDMAGDYFLKSIPLLSDRTRSSLSIVAEVKLSPCWEEPIYSLFFKGESNWSPDDVLKGRIVIFDVPYSVYGSASRCAGAMIKQSVQKAALRRDMSDYDNAPAVGIWADDCSAWLTPFDILAAERGRKNKLFHCFAYQGQSTLESGYGGGMEGKSQADALLLNFNTRFMLGQTDPATRANNAEVIGKEEVIVISQSASVNATKGREGGSEGRSANYTPTERHVVPERAWIGLKNGANKKGIVEAIVFTGELFSNKQRFLIVRLFGHWISDDDKTLFSFYPRAPLSVYFDRKATVRSWARHIPFWKVFKIVLRKPQRFREMYYRWLCFWLGIDEDSRGRL